MFQLLWLLSFPLWVKTILSSAFLEEFSLLLTRKMFSFTISFMERNIMLSFPCCFIDNLKYNHECSSSTLWLQMNCSAFLWYHQRHLPSHLLRDFIPFIMLLHNRVPKPLSFLTSSYKFIKTNFTLKKILNLYLDPL